jgi:hypothetical protein
MAQKQTYSPAELAALYGLSAGTLANWRSRGDGPPFVKRGNRRTGPVSYPADQARQWGEENNYIREEMT